MAEKNETGSSEPSKRTLIAYDPEDRAGPFWMGLGLLCFGFTTGGISGLSIYSGVSQTLLTSVFTFAGGSLLTFGGFVRAQRRAPGVMFLRVSRVGAGLCCFSLGLVGGVLGGISLRVQMAEKAAQVASAAKSSSDVDKKGSKAALADKTSAEKAQPGKFDAFVLHTDPQEECAKILSRSDVFYEGEQGAEEARRELGWLRANVRCGP